MTPQEFSNEFDTLYNNVMSNLASSVDEYEKSIFLTKAQEELVKNHFNPLGNKYQQGVDNSPKRQVDLSNLIEIASTGSGGGITSTISKSIDLRAKSYLLPKDVFIILNEAVTITQGAVTQVTQVIPLHYQEYIRLMSKPYKQPLKNQTWKLLQDSSSGNLLSQLIPKSGSTIEDYTVRYVRKPKPIILTDLEANYDGVSIDGYKQPILTDGHASELNPIMHRQILDRAVELAKVSYMENTESVVQINTRNE